MALSQGRTARWQPSEGSDGRTAGVAGKRGAARLWGGSLCVVNKGPRGQTDREDGCGDQPQGDGPSGRSRTASPWSCFAPEKQTGFTQSCSNEEGCGLGRNPIAHPRPPPSRELRGFRILSGSRKVKSESGADAAICTHISHFPIAGASRGLPRPWSLPSAPLLHNSHL